MSLRGVLKGLATLAVLYLLLAVVTEVVVAIYVNKLVRSASTADTPSDYIHASVSGVKIFAPKVGLI